MDIPQSKRNETDIIPEGILVQNNRDLELRTLMERFEKKVITSTLKRHRWHKTKAASILGIDRKTLFRKIKNYEIL
jgi:DNA-binding NtrC family response regulator